MLDGSPKQQNTFPSLTTKPTMIVQSEPMTEVTPDFANAEGAMYVTESGSVRAVRRVQPLNAESGIVFSCDEVSNIIEANAVHPSKTELPKMETEEGTANDFRL
jgi:hypothetical protein